MDHPRQLNKAICFTAATSCKWCNSRRTRLWIKSYKYRDLTQSKDFYTLQVHLLLVDAAANVDRHLLLTYSPSAGDPGMGLQLFIFNYL